MIDILPGLYIQFPTKNHFRPHDEDTEDFDNVTKTLDSMKNHGRKCSSICCTGTYRKTYFTLIGLTVLQNVIIGNLKRLNK